jgi:hypothetical protein
MTKFSRLIRLLVFGMIVSIFQIMSAFSQNVVFYSKTSVFNPVVVIMCDGASFMQMNDLIERNITKVTPSLLLINSSKLSNLAIRDTVNYFLNNQNLNVYKVFLAIVGTEQLLKRQEDFYDRIYADKCFISTENIPTDSIPTDSSETNNKDYQVIPFDKLNFRKTINELTTAQLWETDMEKIKVKTVQEFHETKMPIELGLGFTKIFLHSNNSLRDIPSNMSVFQVQINKVLGNNYKLMSEIGFSMNMPSKSNMNMESGSIKENDKLIGSTLFTWGVHIAKFMESKDAFHPFIAIGITKSNLMLLYTENSGVDSETYAYGSLAFTTGTEFHFNERVNMDIKASYQTSLNTGPKVSNFNLSAGLNINLHKKTKYYYQYLRMK